MGGIGLRISGTGGGGGAHNWIYPQSSIAQTFDAQYIPFTYQQPTMPTITGKKYIVASAGTTLQEYDTKEAAIDAAADIVNAKDGAAFVVVYVPVAIVKPERKHTVTDVTIGK